MTGQRRGLSMGRLALFSLGAAAAVLALATVALAALEPGPGLGLVIVLAGVAGAIAAMGMVSTRMTRRALDAAAEDERAAGDRGGDPGTGSPR
ncbi:hypothetical protein [Rhodococcus daqingensis]|uniref:Uncharacterized protein n=1 Tax=Rhodococcus daqingensis TaxID=2479363 RepID=A0ABW2RYG9_9NOCA